LVWLNLACNGLIGTSQFANLEWLQTFSVFYLTSAMVMGTQWADIPQIEFCRDYPSLPDTCDDPKGKCFHFIYRQASYHFKA